MRKRTFYAEWLRRAFGQSINKGDYFSSVAGSVVTVITHYLSPDAAHSLSALAWQVPLWGLAAAMALRLVLAPYELWKEQKGRAENAEALPKGRRVLSEANRQALRDTALGLPKQNGDSFDVIYERHSLEAAAFAQKVTEAFNDGGWALSAGTLFWGGPVLECGISLTEPLNASDQQSTICDAVSKALDAAGFNIARSKQESCIKPRLFIHFIEGTVF